MGADMAARIYTEAQRKSAALKSKRWRQQHPEKLRSYTDLARERRQQNPNQREQERERNLFRRYGINAATYDQMFKEQEGRCYLCFDCNTLIGLAHENPLVLEKAASMLRSER
jgi:hypothetical protein